MTTSSWGRRLAIAVALAVLAASPAAAQRALTLDDIYDPARRINFSGSVPPTISWLDDSRYLEAQDRAGGVEWTIVSAVDGSTRALFDPGRLQASLARLPGVSADAARRASRSRALTFDAVHAAALFTLDDDLYVYDIAADRATRLTTAAGEEAVPSFSPDGRHVAFVRGHNLHVVDTATARERALTTDGADQILNGVLDWVYEEEIYGRGQRRGYWWSPDASRIAFLRTDDTPVPTYVVTDDIPYDQTVERWNYPKAGDPNPIVTLGMVALGGGAVRWVDLTAYPDADRLVVSVAWTADSQQLIYEVQNRLQNRLDVHLLDPASGDARRLLRETSRTWVSAVDLATLTWLADGSFLWLSERSGWQHVYHYRADGTLVRPVTSGDWDVRALHGVDHTRGWIYFSATERSYIGQDVYRIRLDGSELTRLSSTPGTHTPRFSAGFGLYLDSWSDVATPTQVRLHRSDGTEVRVVHANRVPALAEFRLSEPEFLQVRARDGFVMEAMMIKPPDFDPSHRYPVYQFTYAGPQSPRVLNQWGGAEYMYHQLLAQKGIIVWLCDNRTASAKGVESAWPVYGNFGELELRDIEDGLAWLKDRPYVDDSRIGMHGWSFGGYMTSYALTHSRSFVMGIAGGTVGDWRSYDTVYTERFMGLPSENEDGYRKSAPRWAAADLHGSLLLIHGAIDENVHPANTMQLAYELQKAGKPFELMLYPKSRHGVTDPQLVRHMRSMMLAFTERYLLPAGSGTASMP